MTAPRITTEVGVQTKHVGHFDVLDLLMEDQRRVVLRLKEDDVLAIVDRIRERRFEQRLTTHVRTRPHFDDRHGRDQRCDQSSSARTRDGMLDLRHRQMIAKVLRELPRAWNE